MFLDKDAVIWNATEQKWDAIVIGSGMGGKSAFFQLCFIKIRWLINRIYH